MWVGGCAHMCAGAEQAEPPPGTGLGRILTQTVCCDITSRRASTCTYEFSDQRTWMITGANKRKERGKKKWCRSLEMGGTWKREMEAQISVGVSARPRSDWELEATLSSLCISTCCHISLTGQQASGLLCPSLTSVCIIIQRWWTHRKTHTATFMKEKHPSAPWAECCG